MPWSQEMRRYSSVKIILLVKFWPATAGLGAVRSFPGMHWSVSDQRLSNPGTLSAYTGAVGSIFAGATERQ